MRELTKLSGVFPQMMNKYIPNIFFESLNIKPRAIFQMIRLGIMFKRHVLKDGYFLVINMGFCEN